MSFILDALKKSEHKRRAQAGGEPVTLYEVNENKIARRRQSMILVMIFVLLGIFLLLALLVWQRPWGGQDNPELPVKVAADQPSTLPLPARQGAAADNQSPAAVAQRQEDIPATVTQPQEEVEPRIPVQPSADEFVEATVESQTISPIVAQPTPAEADRVYSISDLPTDVRRRLPALQMALHAYNATDAQASLVQINGRLVREGAQIAENLSVDEITSEGAILRSGIYRFLLPRRGQ